MDYSKFGETDKSLNKKKSEKGKKRGAGGGGGQEGVGRRRKKKKRRRGRRKIDRVLLTCPQDRVVDGRMDSPCQVRKGGGFETKTKKKKLMVGTGGGKICIRQSKRMAWPSGMGYGMRMGWGSWAVLGYHQELCCFSGKD